MSNFLNWLSNIGQRWAMNTDPVVMQASGYVPTKKEIVYKPSEGSEQLRNNIAVISTVPNIVTNAGLAGIIPTVVSEVGAAAGGYAGNYAGTKLDEKLGTTYLTPTLSIAGALLGGNYGYKAGYNGGKYMIKHDMLPEGAIDRKLVTDQMVKDAATEMLARKVATSTPNKPTLPSNVGWAPAEKSIWWHHSNEPITEFKIPFEGRWDAEKHGADSRLIWFTKEDGTKGMMAKRPHHTQFEIEVKKPMVQVGEAVAPTSSKNPYRNEIVKTARDMGADAVIFDGIADNTLENQKVVAILGDRIVPNKVVNPKHKGYYEDGIDFKGMTNDEKVALFKHFMQIGKRVKGSISKQVVTQILKSDWYKNNVMQKYPNLYEEDIDYLIRYQLDWMDDVQLYHTDLPEGEFGLHWLFNDNGSDRHVALVNKRHPSEIKNTEVHELIHSTDPMNDLPFGINNRDLDMVPYSNIVWDQKAKAMFDYVSSEQELRVTLLELNHLAKVNNVSADKLVRAVRAMVNRGEHVPADIADLLKFYPDEEIVKGMSKVVTLGIPIVATSSLDSDKQTTHENETRK